MTNFTRGVKSKLAAICLAGSMAFGLGSISGCKTTPRGEAYKHVFGQTIVNESIKKVINPNAYEPQREQNTQPTQVGEDFFIVVNLATMESKKILGTHWNLYGDWIKENKRDEYPKGYKIYDYLGGTRSATITWKNPDYKN